MPQALVRLEGVDFAPMRGKPQRMMTDVAADIEHLGCTGVIKMRQAKFHPLNFVGAVEKRTPVHQIRRRARIANPGKGKLQSRFILPVGMEAKAKQLVLPAEHAQESQGA